MTLAELQRVAELLPDGASVTLPVEVLRALAEDSGADGSSDGEGALVDLTVGDVGKLIDRAPSTVRWWCQTGVLPGAYRLRNREWRVPRSALRTLRNGTHPDRPRRASRHAPLDAYKRDGGTP